MPTYFSQLPSGPETSAAGGPAGPGGAADHLCWESHPRLHQPDNGTEFEVLEHTKIQRDVKSKNHTPKHFLPVERSGRKLNCVLAKGNSKGLEKYTAPAEEIILRDCNSVQSAGRQRSVLALDNYFAIAIHSTR